MAQPRAFVRLLRDHITEKVEEGLKPRTWKEYWRLNMRMHILASASGVGLS